MYFTCCRHAKTHLSTLKSLCIFIVFGNINFSFKYTEKYLKFMYMVKTVFLYLIKYLSYIALLS